MTQPTSSTSQRVSTPELVRGNAHVAVVLAWLIPGAGHFYLGRRWRALLFLGFVLFSLVVGCYLSGRLFVLVPGQPLSLLGTAASMGMGIPYFVLRYVIGYQGDLLASSYEYGNAFLLTAGLMNMLVVLDAWDIGQGRKG